jgi:hypothetical protein
MLLNLSNHPSSQWPPEQYAEAIRLYGQILDLAFPDIDPTADEQYIDTLAHKYLQQIRDIQQQLQTPITVHIMGELTFCFALITKLKQHNIPCIASTTRRIANIANGHKTSVFKFVRFRSYL